MPLISVIIPTYNCSNYISSAIRSVLEQSFQDYEIIVMDDGSSDNTREVLGPYMNSIRYFHQVNGGNSKARNEAFKKANGKYIAFLDADDQWKPFKLELQLAIMEKCKNIDLLFTNYDTLGGEDEILEKSGIEKGFPIFQEYSRSLKDFFEFSEKIEEIGQVFGSHCDDTSIYYGNVFEQMFRGNFVLPSTEMFRANCLSEQVKFNENYRCASDQDFHLKFSREHTFAYIDSSTIYYRVNRKNQLSGSQNIPDLIMNTIKSREKVLEDDLSFINEKADLINSVMAKHFTRLAYYYLSILDDRKASVFAQKSLGHDHLNLKAWAILLLAHTPNRALQFAHKIKQMAS